MIAKIKIILIFIFFIPMISSGQGKYCIYQFKALKAYDDKDYLVAKAYMDSALVTCFDIKENAYTWHVLGFIYYDIYKNIDQKSSTSLAREKTIEVIRKSIELDTISEFERTNKKVLINLAISYWNNSVTHLDTINYEKAISFYNSYTELYSFANPEYRLEQSEIIFSQALAKIYEKKFENTLSKNEDYFNSAVKLHKKVLSLDSLNYESNMALGKLYYNLGVVYIFTLEDDIDMFKFIEAQDKAVDNFKISLPYLKTAYQIQPNDKETITGIAGVYHQLHEKEKFMTYMNLLEDIKSKDKEKDTEPKINKEPRDK